MQRIRNLKLERRLVCTLDVEKYYTFNSVNNLLLKEDSKYNIRYLLALLNSNLLNYLLKQYSLNTNITLSDLELLPIKQIDFNNSKENKYHNDIIQLVNQIIESIKLLTNSKSESEKNILSQKIGLIDENINRIIYELYDLTADEINLIES